MKQPQPGGAAAAFSPRPPSCLELLDAEKADPDKFEKVFNDEARDLQSRLKEQLSQVRAELGFFFRLMYKNKNQHRRTLYYQRLAEVRRDLLILSKSGLDETVEGFPKLFRAKRSDAGSSKFSMKADFGDSADDGKALRIFLGVARLLNETNGPIIAGSGQLAGLLGQSFFMPFALTMFSCLARFRVLLMQVHYEVITAFNLLSAFWRRKLMGPAQETFVSIRILAQSLPSKLECHWDGVKLSTTEKSPASIPGSRGMIDSPAEPSKLWFVDDRTGVKYDLLTPATGGPGGEQLRNSPATSNVSKGAFIAPELGKGGNALDVLPIPCRLATEETAQTSVRDIPSARETNERVKDLSVSNVASDVPAVAPMNNFAVSDLVQSRVSLDQRQVSVVKSDHKQVSGISSAGKKGVDYRSVKISLDTMTTGSFMPNSQRGANRLGVSVGVKQQERVIDESREITNAIAPNIMENSESKATFFFERDRSNQQAAQQSDSIQANDAGEISRQMMGDEVEDSATPSLDIGAAFKDSDGVQMALRESRTTLERKFEHEATRLTSPYDETRPERPVNAKGSNLTERSSLLLNPLGAELEMAGPSLETLDMDVSDMITSVNPGFSSHSIGKEDGSGTGLIGSVEQNVRNIESTPTAPNQPNAKSGIKGRMAYTPERSDMKVSQKRREGAKHEPHRKKQQLKSGLRKSPMQSKSPMISELKNGNPRAKDKSSISPMKSELKKGNLDAKEKPGDSESKKRSNDIFAMLLGGFD